MKSYYPKAIRGQKVAGYTKVSHSQVKKLFELGEKFVGFLVGNKVNSFHFFSGWRLACNVNAATMEEFNKSFNSFKFYLESELGNGVSIYLRNQ